MGCSVSGLVGPARYSALLGPARTRCREVFGRALGVRPNVTRSSNLDSGFVTQPKSTWFLPVCSESRGLQKPQGNFTKKVEEKYRLEMVAVRGGCDGVGPFSGVVRSGSWSGFGRGMILSTMVCLVASEMASIDGNGAAAVGDGGR